MTRARHLADPVQDQMGQESSKHQKANGMKRMQDLLYLCTATTTGSTKTVTKRVGLNFSDLLVSKNPKEE